MDEPQGSISSILFRWAYSALAIAAFIGLLAILQPVCPKASAANQMATQWLRGGFPPAQ